MNNRAGALRASVRFGSVGLEFDPARPGIPDEPLQTPSADLVGECYRMAIRTWCSCCRKRIDRHGSARRRHCAVSQAFQLQRTEVCKHRFHVRLAKESALNGLPSLGNRGTLGQRPDVQVLSQSHRTARLLHGNRDIPASDGLDKHNRWRNHSGIGRRAAPIRDDRLDPEVTGSATPRLGHELPALQFWRLVNRQAPLRLRTDCVRPFRRERVSRHSRTRASPACQRHRCSRRGNCRQKSVCRDIW